MQLHPDYPVIEGRYQMTREWSVFLPDKFNRRLDDEDLVIWKPGFTIWIIIWDNNRSESVEDRLEWVKEGTSPQAFDFVTEKFGGGIRHSYRLKEDSQDDRQPAFYGFALGGSDHVQVAMYFDSPDDIVMAEGIWRSLGETPPSEA